LEDWRIKISALWFFYVVTWLLVLMFSLIAPGTIDEIRAGKGVMGEPITGGYLLASAIILLFPLVMAVLSLTLKDSVNRWANIIAGIVFTALSILSSFEALALKDLSVFAYMHLIDISMVVAPALIVWFAWKSKQKA